MAKATQTGATARRDGIAWAALPDARARLAGEIDAFLRAVVAAPDAAHAPLVLRVSAGVGKTEALMAALATHGPDLLAHGHVLIHMPTHRLAEEAQAAFAARAPHAPSMVLRGRGAPNPRAGGPGGDGGRMCARWRLAEALHGLAPGVRRALCETVTAGGDADAAPCRPGCAYFAQFPRENAVVFLAHAYLTAGSPLAGRVALRVVDEKCWTQLVRTRRITADAWLRGAAPAGMGPDRARAAHACVLDALRAGTSPIEALGRLLVTREAVIRLARAQLVRRRDLPCAPSMRDDAIARRLSAIPRGEIEDERTRRAIWEMIGARWAAGATERLTLDPAADGAAAPMLTLHERRSLNDGVASIFLDADADPLIMDVVAPGARMIDIAVRPNATVVQVSDRTLSASSLTTGPDADAMRRDVAAVIRREAARADGGVLVVAPRAVLRALQVDAGAIPPDAPHIPDDALTRPLHGADARWLGPAMQGVNGFRDHATVIVIGRLEPGPAAIEAQLRALFGDGDAPLRLPPAGAGRLQRQTGAWLTADGARRPARVQNHPDPRGAALLRQTREAASLQAIARIRAVSAGAPRRIVVLSSLPLPGLPVDRLVPWRALVAEVDPVTLTPAYRRMSQALRDPRHGRLVDGLRLSPAGMRADAPWAFGTEQAARRWSEALTAPGVRNLAAKVLRDAGVAPRFVLLRHPHGGRPVPAVLTRTTPDPRAAARTTWPHLDVEPVA